MKLVNQIFFKGLIVVLPITLTFYLLFWASAKAESLFGSFLQNVLGKDLYIPGLGIILTIICIFLVGILVSNYMTARFVEWITGKLQKFPLIKAIYNPLKDLMALLPGKSSESQKSQKVVLVDINQSGMKVLGLVTRDDLTEIHNQTHVTVYVPFSYMLGGMTYLVPKDQLQTIDLPVDQAIKLSITSWIKAPENS
jgi:uncharacterized membrane protein